MKEIGNRLEQLMLALSYKKEDFAILLGYTKKTKLTSLQQLFTGKINFSTKALTALMGKHKEINVDWLFHGRGEMFYRDKSYIEQKLKEFDDYKNKYEGVMEKMAEYVKINKL